MNSFAYLILKCILLIQYESYMILYNCAPSKFLFSFRPSDGVIPESIIVGTPLTKVKRQGILYTST